jgi:hypothetical protein
MGWVGGRGEIGVSAESVVEKGWMELPALVRLSLLSTERSVLELRLSVTKKLFFLFAFVAEGKGESGQRAAERRRVTPHFGVNSARNFSFWSRVMRRLLEPAPPVSWMVLRPREDWMGANGAEAGEGAEVAVDGLVGEIDTLALIGERTDILPPRIETEAFFGEELELCLVLEIPSFCMRRNRFWAAASYFSSFSRSEGLLWRSERGGRGKERLFLFRFFFVGIRPSV